MAQTKAEAAELRCDVKRSKEENEVMLKALGFLETGAKLPFVEHAAQTARSSATGRCGIRALVAARLTKRGWT